MRPFLFPWIKAETETTAEERWIVAFVPQLTPDVLPEVLLDYIRLNPAFHRIAILGFAYNRSALTAFDSTQAILDRLPEDIRTDPKRLVYWFINADGLITDANEEPIGMDDAVFSAGAEEIFSASNVTSFRAPILEVPAGFHFVKPSGKHSTHFIRVAEILTEAVAIEFLAASLLRHLTEEVRTISCDTSSIACIAYAIQALASRLQRPNSRRISIMSFGSWTGLNGQATSGSGTDFYVNNSTFYLVSTSTSGDLMRKLVELGCKEQNLAVLYYYGDNLDKFRSVCVLNSDVRARRGIPDIQFFAAEACPLCRVSSQKLELRGDQFLPLEVRKETFEVELQDCPLQLRKFSERTFGTEAIRTHFGVGRLGRTHEIYIDFGRLCIEGPCHQRIMQAIRQFIPFAANRAYVGDDQGSEKLFEIIAEERKASNLPPLELVSADNLESRASELTRDNGSCVVVAGCVTSGRSLMRISRLLRNIERGGNIMYFVGVRRSSSVKDQDHLEKTLTFASEGRIPYAFRSIEDICVNDNTPYQDSIWERERIFLERLIADRGGNPDFPTVTVSERIEHLTQASYQSGIVSSLFWPGPSGPMRLRGNFSFLSKQAAGKASQSDLFFLISSLLHNARSKRQVNRSLETSAHVRTILNPNNFRRFDDGVLRACLLRAALPSELDFALDPNLDSDAAGLFCDIIKGGSSSEGEPVMEFLLSLALQQVRLSATALAFVVRSAQECFQDRRTVEHQITEHIAERLT